MWCKFKQSPCKNNRQILSPGGIGRLCTTKCRNGGCLSHSVVMSETPPAGSSRPWQRLGLPTARICPLQQATCARNPGSAKSGSNKSSLPDESSRLTCDIARDHRNTWDLSHKHGYPYYGAARQEIVLSELSRLRENLRRSGKSFEIALRLRPAKKWIDQNALTGLAAYGLQYQGSIKPLEKFDAESRRGGSQFTHRGLARILTHS